MADDNQTTTTTTTTDNVDAFGNNQTQQNQDTNTQVQNTDQIFNQTVGDGKQYATQEDLAKGKKEADAFIEQLKSENAQMREEMGKRPTMDDIQDIMKLQNDNQANNPELTAEALNTIVDSRVKTIKTEELEHLNVSQASDRMVELYGSKASEQVSNKAKAMGVSVQYLQGLAGKSPDMFYSIMGVDKESSNTSVAGNQTAQGSNTEQFNTETYGTKVGTWDSYEKLRKEDPRKYFSPQVQNEIFKMRKELGENFYK